MNETRELARLATELKYEDIPPDVIKKAEELILDQFGVQVSASTKPWCQAAYKQVRDLNSSGGSTILNYGDKVGAELAAFVNGTFGHGFEIDDTYPQANLHPGCVIVAAALALGCAVVGTNCGQGIATMVGLVAEIAGLTDLPIIAQPNAGLPQLVKGQTVYLETPSVFAASIPELYRAGARIIGGCCGTTAGHVAAIRSFADQLS